MLRMTRRCETTKNGALYGDRSPHAIDKNVREQDLQRQVALVKEQLRDLRASNESNQARLLDQSQRQGINIPTLY